jgi:Transposase DDE domain
MPAIVEFPTVVQEAVAQFGSHFANEPERVHFAEYLTGLFVAEKKNVSGINREFAVTTDQSCLNRWLTAVKWDQEQLNRDRLAWLQEDPSTRYREHGVIPIDNVLVDHEGEMIADAGYFWDHADKRYLIAHDYIIVNYVATSGKHYPLEFRRFVKRDQCQERKLEFKDHNQLVRELVDWVVEQAIPGDFTFDSYFTHADNLNFIHEKQRGYVGDLKFNRKLLYHGQEMQAAVLAAQIPVEARKPVEVDGKRQWYFTKSLRIPGVEHPVRLVILGKERDDQEACKMLVTNRTRWEASRILRVYRRRWRGTECFHRDGKQHLGMGDCQFRKGKGQTRHLYMVFLAHSILMRQVRQGRVHEWAREHLMTIGQACRAVARETLSRTITWVVEHVQEEGWSCQRIKAHLALP